jgi:tight adherence protein B
VILLSGAVAAGVAVAALLVAPLGSITPPRLGHPERDLLRASGWSLSAGRWEAARAAIILVTLAVGQLGGAPYLVPLAAVGPSIALRWRVSSRRTAAARRSLEVLQSVHAGLRAGSGLAQAVRSAVERTDPILRDPFDAALRSFDLNGALDGALRTAARSAWDPRLAFTLEALALVAAEQLPSLRAAALIGAAADRLTHEQRLREEVLARTSGLRGQIVLLALLVPVLALYLGLTMPGLAGTLTSPLGIYVLIPAALVLEVSGILASRAIVGAVEA